MKNNLVYIIIFGAAFLLVTGAIYYLNMNYTNIFAFDFTPVHADGTAPGDGLPKEQADSLKIAALTKSIDSLKAVKTIVDTVQVEAYKDTTLIDSIKMLEEKINTYSAKEKKLKESEIKKARMEDSVKAVEQKIAEQRQSNDSSYNAWIKKTVSLYESMDSKKVAKIIQTYSDNIAKDILYKMKKKKAAEILSQFSPETVNRITSIK